MSGHIQMPAICFDLLGIEETLSSPKIADPLSGRNSPCESAVRSRISGIAAPLPNRCGV